jgi:hypothetical protein
MCGIHEIKKIHIRCLYIYIIYVLITCNDYYDNVNNNTILCLLLNIFIKKYFISSFKNASKLLKPHPVWGALRIRRLVHLTRTDAWPWT